MCAALRIRTIRCVSVRARRTSALPLVALVLPLSAAADDKQDFSKVEIKATKVAGQVYVIEDVTKECSGGNVGVSVGPDGIVLIDDKQDFSKVEIKATKVAGQ